MAQCVLVLVGKVLSELLAPVLNGKPQPRQQLHVGAASTALEFGAFHPYHKCAPGHVRPQLPRRLLCDKGIPKTVEKRGAKATMVPQTTRLRNLRFQS